jgi:hypothetical protein
MTSLKSMVLRAKMRPPQQRVIARKQAAARARDYARELRQDAAREQAQAEAARAQARAERVRQLSTVMSLGNRLAAFVRSCADSGSIGEFKIRLIRGSQCCRYPFQFLPCEGPPFYSLVKTRRSHPYSPGKGRLTYPLVRYCHVYLLFCIHLILHTYYIAKILNNVNKNDKIFRKTSFYA